MSGKKVLNIEERRARRKERSRAYSNNLDQLRAVLQPGLTLSNKSKDSWAILLPDASQPSQFRYQLFDSKGFISHHVESSLDKALEAAFSCGYSSIDAGALDRESKTQEWAKGMAIQAIRDQYNYGKISWDELFVQLKEVQEQYLDVA